MFRVVLDTNIFVSALNFSGNPRQILNLARKGSIVLITSPYILEETYHVLIEKFGWSYSEANDAVAKLKSISEIVNPIESIDIIKEKDSDNRIIECAICGKANYIITGDTKHILPLRIFQGIRILTPTQFLLIFS